MDTRQDPIYHPTPITRGRIAEVLRIRQLVVIAGPSCAGKSYLLTRIRQEQCGGLCAQLGILNPSSCPQMQAVEFEGMNEGTFDTVLVHFDFYTLDISQRGYRVLSKLLSNADSATILTLCAGSKSLVERNNKRVRKAVGNFLSSLLWNPTMLARRIHLMRWVLKRHRIYKDPSAVAAIYQKWADAIASHDATHYWLDSDQSSTSATCLNGTAEVGLFSNARSPALGKQEPATMPPEDQPRRPNDFVNDPHSHSVRHKEALRVTAMPHRH